MSDRLQHFKESVLRPIFSSVSLRTPAYVVNREATYTLKEFKAWLRSRDPAETFWYHSYQDCCLLRYLREHGEASDLHSQAGSEAYSRLNRNCCVMLPDESIVTVDMLACASDGTMGNLLHMTEKYMG